MNTIHLGNYEEFFILYMDNELSEEQVKMVDDFLAANPDLKAEFEMLMTTKLPLEEFRFDKTDLMAENMELCFVDEELLLYIDNELTADKKKKVELELAANRDFQLQHQVLLQTKLDPSEKIAYPNKKELYRKTERVVSIKIWMRVAAAVVIIAVGGLFYFRNTPSISTSTDSQTTAGPGKVNQKNDIKKNDLPNRVTPSFENPKRNEIAVTNPAEKETKQDKSTEKKEVKVENPVQQQDEIAYAPQEIKKEVERSVVRNIDANHDKGIEETIASVNKDFVTSSLASRLDNSSGDDEKSYASNDDRKGSIKGFLRKATRLIEKRTGIDPTNDGELLIGAVAINLK